MKKSLLLLAALAAATVGTASAQTTVIDITGATAFRSSVHATLRNATAVFNSAANYGWVGNSSSFSAANLSIFIGNVTGITGNTIIRCSWSGSTEGIRDLVTSGNVSFLEVGNVFSQTNSTGFFAANSSTEISTNSSIGFTDSDKSLTPFNSSQLSVLTQVDVGVIVFVPIASKNSNTTALFTSGNASDLGNVSQKQLNALFTGGVRPLSFFTGNLSDTTQVYATGRNDGSGTRTIYLSEIDAPVADNVQQWKPILAADNNSVEYLQFWPTSDGVNASTLWGDDQAGNGGFFSGGGITDPMIKNATNVTVIDSDGNTTTATVIEVAASPIMISVVGTSDAAKQRTGGAKALAYNGVSVIPTSSGYSTTDGAKIKNGAYTFWSYERILGKGVTVLGPKKTVFDKLKASGGIPSNLGTSGFKITDMTVSRSTDGGIVQ